jgi:hypothetical protein
MYSYSGDSEPGWKYGAIPSSSAASGISMYKRSRSFFSWSGVIFLIWCVALRASKSLPSVHPLIVLARMTVGVPSCSIAVLYAA